MAGTWFSRREATIEVQQIERVEGPITDAQSSREQWFHNVSALIDAIEAEA